METVGSVAEGKEGVFQFLRERAASASPIPGSSNNSTAKKPFFLVISLVNPHDVLFYPSQFAASGYSPSLLQGDVQLPQTYAETLLTKPRAQREWVALNLATGAAPQNISQARDYINFYANLVKQTDSYLNATLSLLDELGLTDDTVVIKTADHGEMGMSHGGQIQKMFNFYEESMRVPLIFSNPVLYPKPLKSSALVSHVDWVPTMAELLLGKPKASALSAAAGFQGVSYADSVADPTNNPKSPQDEIVFLYDDFQFGQPTWPGYPFPPNHIRSIVEERWKVIREKRGRREGERERERRERWFERGVGGVVAVVAVVRRHRLFFFPSFSLPLFSKTNKRTTTTTPNSMPSTTTRRARPHRSSKCMIS